MNVVKRNAILLLIDLTLLLKAEIGRPYCRFRSHPPSATFDYPRDYYLYQRDVALAWRVLDYVTANICLEWLSRFQGILHTKRGLALYFFFLLGSAFSKHWSCCAEQLSVIRPYLTPKSPPRILRATRTTQ